MRTVAHAAARGAPGATRVLGDERSDEELEASATSSAAPADRADPEDPAGPVDARCADGSCAPPPSLDGKGTRINTYA